MSAARGRDPRFWERYQPGMRFSSAPPGSAEFFAQVEEHRYALEPHIPALVQFERWRDRDVLEAGCGIATDGVRFARAGARYTGLDASTTAVTLARRRLALQSLPGDVVEGSVTELPFDDASFDLVYSHGVLHHIAGTERAVAELHRVLRPGGTALVMLYHRRSLNYQVSIMLLRRVGVGLLLLPRAAAVVGRLTGEDRAVLDAHAHLLRRHRVRYLRDRQLFLSHNTDGPGNPLSKAYSRAEAQRLFGRFQRVETQVRFLNLRLYPGGDALAGTTIGRRLERRWGWHLYVAALKATG